MMITLEKIKETLQNIKGVDSNAIQDIDEVIDILRALNESLDNVSVTGRADIDAMLGCMMGIDMIIGEEE